MPTAGYLLNPDSDEVMPRNVTKTELAGFMALTYIVAEKRDCLFLREFKRRYLVVNIKEAVEQCKQSGLNGIELIEYAQKLVGINMKYSYSNSFDLPYKAFQKGYGYCWQQASVLIAFL